MTVKLYPENTVPSDFLAAIGMGVYSNARAIHKFGHNPAVEATYETIWGESNVYVYRDTAVVMKVSSSDTDDTSAGAGAQTVVIEGLDSDYTEISETVILNGQTEVNTTNSYLRVHRMYVVTAGATGSNEGIVYAGTGTVTTGKPAVVHSHIAVGDNQTMQCIYTIPVNHTGYLFQHQSFSGISKEVDSRIIIRELNEVFQSKDIFSFTTGQAVHDLRVPITLPAKTDIETQARAAAGGGSVSAHMLIVLISD